MPTPTNHYKLGRRGGKKKQRGGDAIFEILKGLWGLPVLLLPLLHIPGVPPRTAGKTLANGTSKLSFPRYRRDGPGSSFLVHVGAGRTGHALCPESDSNFRPEPNQGPPSPRHHCLPRIHHLHRYTYGIRIPFYLSLPHCLLWCFTERLQVISSCHIRRLPGKQRRKGERPSFILSTTQLVGSHHLVLPPSFSRLPLINLQRKKKICTRFLSVLFFFFFSCFPIFLFGER